LPYRPCIHNFYTRRAARLSRPASPARRESSTFRLDNKSAFEKLNQLIPVEQEREDKCRVTTSEPSTRRSPCAAWSPYDSRMSKTLIASRKEFLEMPSISEAFAGLQAVVSFSLSLDELNISDACSTPMFS